MRRAKRKILSSAMALAMAASVLSWAPVQAYADESAPAVTQSEETQAEATPTPEAEATPVPTAEPAVETATPTPAGTETTVTPPHLKMSL